MDDEKGDLSGIAIVLGVIGVGLLTASEAKIPALIICGVAVIAAIISL